MIADDTKKLEQKNVIQAFCIAIIEERIALAKRRIDSAQHAANQEEKSSAGDKYETSRAMGHLEKDMFSRQLAAIFEELARCKMIDASRLYDSVQPGAIISCDPIIFFIGAGLGKHLIDDKEILLLSPSAPLAKLLLGQKEGFKFTLSGKELSICQIY